MKIFHRRYIYTKNSVRLYFGFHISPINLQPLLLQYSQLS